MSINKLIGMAVVAGTYLGGMDALKYFDQRGKFDCTIYRTINMTEEGDQMQIHYLAQGKCNLEQMMDDKAITPARIRT